MATLQEVRVPDIGDFKDIPVIELLVKPGDTVKKEDSLVTLESDKATMEVPSPAAGIVKELKVKIGDLVGEGSLVLILEATGAAPSATATPAAGKPAAPAPAAAPAPKPPAPQPTAPGLPAAGAPSLPPLPATSGERGKTAHASPRHPALRAGTRRRSWDALPERAQRGASSRRTSRTYVKQALSGGAAAAAPPATGGGLAGLGLPAWPKVDFAKFGPVEARPLSRIQKISGPALARNWLMIPHVTQQDEADITDLEAFRNRINEENAKAGIKVSPLAFLVKACVAALKKYPDFNSSLDGDNLVVKGYWHIGFAADTPNGLVVPVIKDADKKGVIEIARESGELAAKAREGKLGPADMQGGTFSISSLGGIGGSFFTPIVNAPEVAILGVSKSQMKPVWDGKEFVPRLIMPLSLSYDHRVIDGASAARFTTYLAQVLADMRRIVL